MSEYTMDSVNLTRQSILGHVLMFLILIFIIMLHIKNYLVTEISTYNSYSYVVAFGIPATFILFVGTITYYLVY